VFDARGCFCNSATFVSLFFFAKCDSCCVTTVIAGVGRDAGATASVRVTEVIESEKAPLARYEPGNPVADADGFVYAPDINPVEQMVDMISASRSYQNSIEVMNSSKEMLLATLRLGQ